jgi:hypothetical protein
MEDVMRPLVKILDLDKLGYYQTHLAICNAILPVKMTPKEIEVLASFMSLEGDLSSDRFGTTARKMVRGRLGLTSGGLGNYLKTLKDKGFILVQGDGYRIWPLLFPDPRRQAYQFLLKMTDNVNGKS